MTDSVDSDGEDAVNEPAAGSDGTFPYAAYAGAMADLAGFVERGIPQVLDRPFFGSLSGALIAQKRGFLRFFGFIDDEHRPTTFLRQYVDADESGRKVMLTRVAQEKYADVIELARTNGTQGQLQAIFRERGLNGSTQAKAINFYMNLARDLELPISPFFQPPRVNGSSGSPSISPRRSRKKKPAEPEHAPPPVEPVDTVAKQKSAYVEMLMQLASREGEGLPPSDLLDRIERALGYDPPAKEGT